MCKCNGHYSWSACLLKLSPLPVHPPLSFFSSFIFSFFIYFLQEALKVWINSYLETLLSLLFVASLQLPTSHHDTTQECMLLNVPKCYSKCSLCSA